MNDFEYYIANTISELIFQKLSTDRIKIVSAVGLKSFIL